jgi:glycosyltransferase involved in cell wall biosynthesis
LVEDGVNGFWARDEEEWKKSIMRLIEEEGLRKEMGMKGRKAVEKAYSLKANAPRILDILSRVSTLRG